MSHFLAHDALLAHSRQELVLFRSPFTGVEDPVPLTILKVLPLWLCRDRTVEATKELLHHVSQPTHSSGVLVGRNGSCFDAKKFEELNIGFQKQGLKDTDVAEL